MAARYCVLSSHTYSEVPLEPASAHNYGLSKLILEKIVAQITASMVKELRAKTDAPMMECKKALTEANGDMAEAEKILRVKLDRKSTRLNSSHVAISYAVFCLKKKKK